MRLRRTSLLAGIALAAAAVLPAVAAGPASASVSPALLVSGHHGGGTTQTTGSFTVTSGSVVLVVLGQKQGTVNPPEAPSYSFSTGTWTHGGNVTNYYDDTGGVTAQLQADYYTCTGSCSSVTMTINFPLQNQSAWDYQVVNLGTTATFQGSSTSGLSSSGQTSVDFSTPNSTNGYTIVNVGAHEVNEATAANYSFAGVTFTDLASTFGTGNSSMDAEWVVTAGGSPTDVGSTWSTTSPGGGLALAFSG